MRGAGHVARKETEKCIYNLSETPKGRDNLEDLGIDVRILKWASKKLDVKVWTGVI
jgi:hypothetical protein